MALTSETIGDKIKECLSEIDEVDKMLVYGYIKEVFLNENCPSEIMKYCAIFAFLKWRCWLNGGENWSINGYQAVRDGECKIDSWSTMYADPVIKTGKYEWRIKIIEKSTDFGIGLTSNMNNLNKYGIGRNGGDFGYFYLSYGGIMPFDKRNSTDYPSRKTKVLYKAGDIITVHLDLDEGVIGFSKNDKYLGDAFMDIMRVEYRLAVCVGKKNKKQMIEIVA